MIAAQRNNLYGLESPNFENDSYLHRGKINTCVHLKTKIEYVAKIFELGSKNALREYEVFRRCRNGRHIVQLVGIFREPCSYLFVLEKMAGGSLRSYLVEHGFMPELVAAGVARQVVSGLCYLHQQNIIHRDIKPDNILYDGILPTGINARINPAECVVKMCDFDMSKVITPSDLDENGNVYLTEVLGSTPYMPPEIVRRGLENIGGYDYSCDLWSLGVTVYELIYNQTPFVDEDEYVYDDNDENELQRDRSTYWNILHKELRFLNEDDDYFFMSVSDEAKSFLSVLLQKEQRARLTAEETLSSFWLSDKFQLPNRDEDDV